MNISANLRKSALQEFELNFGELISDFERDSEVYSFMVNEFLKGVEFGLANNTHHEDDFTREAETRYQYDKATADKHIEMQVKKCAQLVFLYGASWGHTIVNGVLV